jgi:hypothetical protein
MDWKSVDLPTFARPTYIIMCKYLCSPSSTESCIQEDHFELGCGKKINGEAGGKEERGRFK